MDETMSEAKITDLLGLTLVRAEGKVGGDEIIFETKDGDVYKLYHFQDCCESVLVEDICGDLQDLVGSPIVQAEVNCNRANSGTLYYSSSTWTFYRIATAKGQVVIRWRGESNGYYSERVDFKKVKG